MRGRRGLLQPRAHRDGHLRVKLKGRDRWVHHLVLEAFVGPCPKGKQCCHRDDNPTNNWLSNLRWDTPRGNAADRVRNGKQARLFGSSNGSAKLNAAKVQQIREMKRRGLRVATIAAAAGVSRRQVTNVLSGKSWPQLPEV